VSIVELSGSEIGLCKCISGIDSCNGNLGWLN